jgi:hypothetical protein
MNLGKKNEPNSFTERIGTRRRGRAIEARQKKEEKHGREKDHQAAAIDWGESALYEQGFTYCGLHLCGRGIAIEGKP